MMYKRKIKGRTNYQKRLELIKSNKPRLLVRKLSKTLVGQVIEYMPDGDKTLLTVNTKDLTKLGYSGFTRNVPSAYLLGLFLAKKSKEKNLGKEMVPDIGFHKITKGSIMAAFLKGARDGGIDMKIDEKIFPEEARLNGEHIEKFNSKETISNINKIKEKIK